MTNGEKVAEIRQAWHELMLTHGLGPAVDIDLFAQVAINVLTDWHKRGTAENGIKITPNGSDSLCVCGYIHLCCNFLINGGCPYATPDNHWNHHRIT